MQDDIFPSDARVVFTAATVSFGRARFASGGLSAAFELSFEEALGFIEGPTLCSRMPAVTIWDEGHHSHYFIYIHICITSR